MCVFTYIWICRPMTSYYKWKACSLFQGNTSIECICVCVYIYMCVCVCVHIYTYTYIFISYDGVLYKLKAYSLFQGDTSIECIYVCVCVYINICVCVCVHIYIYTYILRWRLVQVESLFAFSFSGWHFKKVHAELLVNLLYKIRIQGGEDP